MEETDLSLEAYLSRIDKSTKNIDFGSQKHRTIPAEIGTFVALEEVYGWENRLSALPSEFALLKNLRIVVLNSNLFRSFPDLLYELPNVTDLHFARNRLSSLPNGLVNLKLLRVLSLEYNYFTSVPDEIYLCENLEELNLNGNKIGNLSDSIGRLLKLQKLELAETNLKVLPDSISQLTHLNVLSVECNNLTTFPPGIKECASLKYIRAHYNDFLVFPEVLLSLPKLIHTAIGGSKGLISDRNTFLANPNVQQLLGQSILEKCEEPHEILKNLYLGSFFGAKNKHYLVSRKVTDIITIMEEDHAAVYPELFNYHLISLDDITTADLLSHFSKAHEIIERAKGATLVHCQMGVSRSATLVISYVMKKKKISAWEAFAEVSNIREIIHPNSGFIKQLKNYEVLLGVKVSYPEVESIEEFYTNRKSSSSTSSNHGNCILS